MSEPGIDIEKELKAICDDYRVAYPGMLANALLRFCLRVAEAAIKAERDRCAERVRGYDRHQSKGLWDMDYLADEIIANGETK